MTDLPLEQPIEIRQHYSTPFPSFKIEKEGEPFAFAEGNYFSLAPTYTLYDTESRPIAKLEGRFFAWGTAGDLFDEKGELIGRFEENIFRILPWAEYRLFSKEGPLLATAQMNLFGTEFEVFTPSGLLLASLSRPFCRFYRDVWSLTAHVPLDPRLLILLAVLQTDVDNRNRFWGDWKEAFIQKISSFESLP
jgi:hypothetical protein